MQDCCLVIPTYRRPTELIELLEALSNRTDVPSEVVVADGSPSRQVEQRIQVWLARREFPFELVYVACPTGLTRQRNAGVDISTREYVFFLDDDSLPLQNYFRHIREVFLNDIGKSIGAVGGSVVNELDKPIPRRWLVRLAVGLVPRIEPMRYDSCGTCTPKGLMRRFRGVRTVDVLPGCAFAFRREVFERHRFSSFFEGYSQGEDLEMSLRIATDWEVVCSGDAEILHRVASGGRPPSFDKGRMEVRNKFFIWKRHRPSARLIDRFRFWSDVGLLLTFDLLHFFRRPWHTANLAHAAGLLSATSQCLVVPPRHLEPDARKEYRLALEV